jgi:hypothetical protein
MAAAGTLRNASVTFDSSEAIIKCHAFANETHSWDETTGAMSACSVSGDADIATDVDARGKLLVSVSGAMEGAGGVSSMVYLFATVSVGPRVPSMPTRVVTFDGFVSFGAGLDSQRVCTVLMDHLAHVIAGSPSLPAAAPRDLESFGRVLIAFTTGMPVNPERKERKTRK